MYTPIKEVIRVACKAGRDEDARAFGVPASKLTQVQVPNLEDSYMEGEGSSWDCPKRGNDDSLPFQRHGI